MASPALTEPPGELMYRLMSPRGSSADSSSNWAQSRFAIWSSTSAPSTMMRWYIRRAASWSSSVPVAASVVVMRPPLVDDRGHAQEICSQQRSVYCGETRILPRSKRDSMVAGQPDFRVNSPAGSNIERRRHYQGGTCESLSPRRQSAGASQSGRNGHLVPETTVSGGGQHQVRGRLSTFVPADANDHRFYRHHLPDRAHRR